MLRIDRIVEEAGPVAFAEGLPGMGGPRDETDDFFHELDGLVGDAQQPPNCVESFKAACGEAGGEMALIL
jgi:hypothetical protein